MSEPTAATSVEGIGASEPPEILDRSVIDAAERVSDDESFAMARRLVREEGLLVGGSAGTNVVAAIRVAMRGDRDGPVVTVLRTARIGIARRRGCARGAEHVKLDHGRHGGIEERKTEDTDTKTPRISPQRHKDTEPKGPVNWVASSVPRSGASC